MKFCDIPEYVLKAGRALLKINLLRQRSSKNKIFMFILHVGRCWLDALEVAQRSSLVNAEKM